MSNTNTKKYLMRKNLKKIGITIFVYTGVMLFLMPFFMMVAVSLKTPYEALVSPSSFPTEFQFDNYAQAWEMMNYSSAFFNSIYVTGLSVGGIVMFGAMAAYVIAKSKNILFNKMYVFFIAGIMIPFQATLVPIAKLITDLNLTNSRTGLVLIYCGRTLPLAMFLYVGFIRGISKDIIEAASIDGANVWVVFWRVVFPMLLPITTTVIIVNSLWIWNDYLLPSLVLSKADLLTIPLSQYSFYGQYGTQWQLAFSAYILGMIPILIMYVFLQKYIIKGVAAGAVKG